MKILLTTALFWASTFQPFLMAPNWETFQSEEGNFKIEMPDLPVFEQEILVTEGGDLAMNMFIYEAVEGDDNLLYLINFTDYPDSLASSDMPKEQLEAYFRSSVDGVVANVDGKLLTEKSIHIFGYEGREFDVAFENDLAVIRMQIFLVKNRMYTLQTISLTNFNNNPSQERFFKSFEFLR